MNIVSEDYTTDTITYALFSNQALSGRSSNCFFNMGHYLRREYDFYVLQTLSFVSSISKTSMFFLEIPDIGFSYNTDENHTIIQVAYGLDHFQKITGRSQYNLRHIIKNWNGLTLNFKYRDVSTSQDSVNQNDPWGNWCILMTLTPVYNRPTEQTIYKIKSRQYESFTYFVSSVNKVSGDQYTFYIDFPAINDQYTDYFFQCNAIMTDYTKFTQGNTARRFTIVACENLFETGYGGIPNKSNTKILGYFTGTPLQPSVNPEQSSSGDYYCGVVKNMKAKKRVKFEFYEINFTKMTSGIDANMTICINFLVTPIK